MDDQNVSKNTHFSPNKVTGNSYSLFNMAEPLQTLKESFIFLIFLCIRIEINLYWHDLLLNISLTVGQSLFDKSFTLQARDLITLTTDIQPVIY